MIDLVTANEFTFTPSAFLAAYIEQSETTTVSETTSNGGALNTLPKQINNLTGSSAAIAFQPGATFTNVSGTFTDGSLSWSNPILSPGPSGSGGAYSPTRTLRTGILSSVDGQSFSINSSLVDIVGQEVLDTRTTTKTVTTAKGVANTVVLVLSYGSFKAKCDNAQATVTAIYTQVAAYLNSL